MASPRKKPSSTKIRVSRRARGASKGDAKEAVLRGFARDRRGIFVPKRLAKPVPPGKIQKGLREARTALRDILDPLLAGTDGKFELSEIEVTASFNADGKFLGFGVGGAASIKLTIRPVHGRRGSR